MRGDRRALREGAVADGTAEGFFTAVCADVSRQVGRLRERLATRRAYVRLLARMRTHVCLECARPRVRLAADATQVRLLRAAAATAAMTFKNFARSSHKRSSLTR